MPKAKWTPIGVTGGCVNSREDSNLQPGELTSANRTRLKPNDLTQVHRDKGNTELWSLAGVLQDPTYVNWEGKDGQILVLNGSTVQYPSLTTVDARTGAIDLDFFWKFTPMTDIPERIGVAHRGNEYFVGVNSTDSDVYNVVVSEDGGTVSARRLGQVGIGPTYSWSNVTEWYTESTAGSTNWADNDVILYWITEYDSVNDIESGPIWVNIVDCSGAAVKPQIWMPWVGGPVNRNAYTKQNSGTDTARIYRAHLGNTNDLDVSSIQNKIIEYDGLSFVLAGRGGLLDTIDWDETDLTTYYDGDNIGDIGTIDPPQPWPQIYVNAGSVTALFEKLVYPRDFDIAVVFNDSLVVNDPQTSKQIIRFSPPGQPEYQPDPYFLYFATKSSDTVVGMEKLNGRLIVLLNGSVWRVNYLPYEGFVASTTGKVQESINENEGCVSREAYRTVESEQGEVLVWLSPEGLRATNGVGWTDICPDFTTEGAGLGGLSTAVLNDNRSLYRLELYVGDQRWDFYYHPSLLKDGKFRMMGPTTMNFEITAATSGELNTRQESWIASDYIVLRQNTVDDQSEPEWETGQIHPPNPMMRLRVEEVGLTHNAQIGESASVTVTVKDAFEDSTSETVSMDMDRDETTPNSLAGSGLGGNWVKLKCKASAFGDHAIGPMWMKAEVLEDQDG